MGSESREVRVRQLQQIEQQLAARLSIMAGKSVDGKAAEKDRAVRHLRAEIAKSRNRVAAIDVKEALKKSLEERKAKKKEQEAAAKKKGKKKAAAKSEQKNTQQKQQGKGKAPKVKKK